MRHELASATLCVIEEDICDMKEQRSPEHGGPEEEVLASTEASNAAELAHANIERFLKLQSGRAGALIMRAHEQDLALAGEAAGAAAELAAINIRRFLELQSTRNRSLIMRAHAAESEVTEAKEG